MFVSPDARLASILRHDRKVTSYKIALLRALNDVVLAFPDIAPVLAAIDDGEVNSNSPGAVAVPLRLLAEFWVAYYWPFADPKAPILQGPISVRDGALRHDISFRPALEHLRAEWATVLQSPALASDGYYLLSEFRVPRRRTSYPPSLQSAYDAAVTACIAALGMPIRHAGEGEYTVFDRPRRWGELAGSNAPTLSIIPVPGTLPNDLCLAVTASLWHSFHALSLWVEALAIHEWCLFTERVNAGTGPTTGHTPIIDRGAVYSLLTARPGNRRPLTWERHRIELLMLEGVRFQCPWTNKRLTSQSYDLDHLLPLAVYPVNELWNLVPADPTFNQRTKRDRLPSLVRLQQAQPLVAQTYGSYLEHADLRAAIHADAALRFSALPTGADFAGQLAHHALRFIEEVAQARSIARF